MSHTRAPSDAADRSAWYAVVVLMLANVSGLVDRQVLSLLVTPVRRDLGISDTQMSLLLGLGFVLFYTVLGVPIGRLADARSRPRLIAVGVALWSVMTTLTGLARSFPQLFLARVGVGVGEATLGPAAVSLIADLFPRERRGAALGVYSLGTFFGSGVAYFIGGAALALAAGGDRVLPLVGAVRPWQLVFFFVGLPGLALAPLALTMREPRGTPNEPRRAAPLGALLAFLRSRARAFLGLSVGFGCSAAVNYGIAAWLATFFVRTYGWPASRAGMVQGVLTMTIGVAGAVAGGRLADRWVRRGMVDGPVRVGLVGAAGMLVFAGAYPLAPSAGAAVALLAVVNLFAALPWGAAAAAIADMMPAPLRAQGTALYLLIVSLLSGAVGPTAVALLTDRVFHDDAALRYSLALTSTVGMALAMALLALAMPAYRRAVAADGE